MIKIPTIIKTTDIPKSTRTRSVVTEFMNQLSKLSKDDAIGFTEKEIKPQTVALRVKRINESHALGVEFKTERRKSSDGLVTVWISHK